MTYTTLPSTKGQITIPSALRKKYRISNETPLVVSDKGNGMITIKIMRLAAPEDVTYYENDKEMGLMFKKGIDPAKLLDAIKLIDG